MKNLSGLGEPAQAGMIEAPVSAFLLRVLIFPASEG